VIKLWAVILPYRLPRKKSSHNKFEKEVEEEEECLLGKAELSRNRTGCLTG
jgi:hypothetical protein